MSILAGNSRWTCAVLAAAGLTLVIEQSALVRFEDPYIGTPPTLSSEVSELRDFAGILAGCRRLAADVAWVETLQYYGAVEGKVDTEEEENGGGEYPRFAQYCRRVAQLDPHFLYVYYYGGSSLGWNLKRLDEAEALLRLGIQNNPKEWRLPQYLAALAYQKDHNPARLIAFLEGFLNDPDCPNMLRALLANLYEKQGRYRESLGIWRHMAETGDASDSHRAWEKIRRINDLISQKAHEKA